MFPRSFHHGASKMHWKCKILKRTCSNISSSQYITRLYHVTIKNTAKNTFQAPRSISKPSSHTFSSSNTKNSESFSGQTDSMDYIVIYQRPYTNRSKYITCLMIFFGLACFMQADTSWRYKLMKVNQLIKLDIGSEGILPATATSSKIPSYIRSFTQSEIKPTDGKIKTFLVVYGNTMLFSIVGIFLLLGTKVAMRHFCVLEMGFYPRMGRAKIVLPKWHGFSLQEKEFSIRDAQFMSARAASNILLHNMEDVAVKLENELFYYRLPLGGNANATFEEEKFHSLIKQNGKQFKVAK